MEYLVNNTPNVRENTMLQVFLVAQQVLNCAPACVSLVAVFFSSSVLTGRLMEVLMKYVVQVTDVLSETLNAD